MKNRHWKINNNILSISGSIPLIRNQINPHFFFNALNSLHALIVEGQNQKSLAYLSNLSNVFRYILQSEKKELVALKDELSFLETYRFMLSVKYEEKLTFRHTDQPSLYVLPATGSFLATIDRKT